jgi:hypothetical protein
MSYSDILLPPNAQPQKPTMTRELFLNKYSVGDWVYEKGHYFYILRVTYKEVEIFSETFTSRLHNKIHRLPFYDFYADDDLIVANQEIIKSHIVYGTPPSTNIYSKSIKENGRYPVRLCDGTLEMVDVIKTYSSRHDFFFYVGDIVDYWKDGEVFVEQD